MMLCAQTVDVFHLHLGSTTCELGGTSKYDIPSGND